MVTHEGTYIKITDDIDNDNYSPTDEELMLDNDCEMEYNTPYTNYNDDLPDFGGVIEATGIFDDR